MKNHILIGNNLATIVAALELIRHNKHVTLYTDDKNLGGHFAGINIQGINFDIGMVMIEKLHSEKLDGDILTYNPSIRNDWVRFCNTTSRWLDQNASLKLAPTPNCLFNNMIYPDFIVANRMEVFRTLKMHGPSLVSKENQLHASHKNYSHAYDDLTYAEAALINHGQKIHDNLIEPFVVKLTNLPSTAFLARYHRAFWAPLFYPETITLALEGSKNILPEYQFWTTKTGFTGDLINNLKDKIQFSKNLNLITSPIKSLSYINSSWVINTEDQVMNTSDEISLGLPVDRIQDLLSLPKPMVIDSASMCILFALVKSSSIQTKHSSLMIIDNSYASYRLTDQDQLAMTNCEDHRITLEASPSRLQQLYPAIKPEAALKNELIKLFDIKRGQEDTVKVMKFINAPNALALPTKSQLIKSATELSLIRQAAPRANLLGGLLGYGVASLNDQIVQGLKLAKESL
jgi:hypothetical protein